MAQEIERKFLVKGEFKRYAKESAGITQGYLVSSAGRTVRVRIKGERGFITIKGSSNLSGTTRFEWEKEITFNEAEQLLAICEPITINKTRYLVNAGNHVFEVDEFHGENQGLILAEIELTYEDEPFQKPDWLGEEVTGDRRYYNSYLSKNPYTSWQ